MINLKTILGLRPKEETPSEISAAIARAVQAHQRAMAEVERLEAGRGDVLVDGNGEDVERAESALTAARADAERALAMVQTLRHRLGIAQDKERDVVVVVEIQRAEILTDRFNAWLSAEYTQLAEKLAAGMRMEAEALGAISRAHQRRSALPFEQQARFVVPAAPAPWKLYSESLHGTVRLPGLTGAMPFEPGLWPVSYEPSFGPPSTKEMDDARRRLAELPPRVVPHRTPAELALREKAETERKRRAEAFARSEETARVERDFKPYVPPADPRPVEGKR